LLPRACTWDDSVKFGAINRIVALGNAEVSIDVNRYSASLETERAEVGLAPLLQAVIRSKMAGQDPYYPETRLRR